MEELDPREIDNAEVADGMPMPGSCSPTKEKPKIIQAINKNAVHQICSGQVVLNLAIAVKELVENSLDAGATSVEVRLKEYGSKLIEVIDNGCGVDKANFQGLTLKHHTSKLQDFSDLVSVCTFGFRGEALSSLCALSDLTVVTRHTDATCATKLRYDHAGHIDSQATCARQVGTTVSVGNLFGTLPVRQKEFHRNLKREFAKMTQLLYAYCLVSTNVKMVCTNQTAKGSRSTIVSTNGSRTVRENIACVFGAKQVQSLVEVTVEEGEMFTIEGQVSSCAHGQGRGASDRQFYYVNSRPCEPNKMMKIVNEVYHTFNGHQQPFVFLNVLVARANVDVNVTPDKRQVFMEHEKHLLEAIKSSLLRLYESTPSTFQYQNPLPLAPSPLPPPTTAARLTALLSQWKQPGSLKRALEGDSNSPDSPKQPCIMNFFKRRTTAAEVPANSKTFESSGCLATRSDEKNGDVASEGCDLMQQTTKKDSSSCYVIEDVFDSDFNGDCKIGSNESVNFSKHAEQNTPRRNQIELVVLSEEIQFDDSSSSADSDTKNISVQSQSTASLLEARSGNKDVEQRPEKCDDTDLSEMLDQSEGQARSEVLERSEVLDRSKVLDRSDVLNRSEGQARSDMLGRSEVQEQSAVLDRNEVLDRSEMLDRSEVQEQSEVLLDEERPADARRRRVWSSITLDQISERLARRDGRKSDGATVVRFRAGIDPSKNQSAEQELGREIAKHMFQQMQIVGQFNLGFVIVRLDSDLFIVDQHASDEKYNFETLQRTQALSSQQLMHPQALELSAVAESVLTDNLDVFKSNGFAFNIDQAAAVTKRVKLTAIPVSRNWEFGKEDVDELLFMLQDATPGTMCRPSRVRDMFASRACRKSVMVGTALSQSDMRRLLDNMGKIDQPWNCPHGRPTMRHLVNLDLLQS